MCEECIFCKGQMTGAEIFKALDDFFKDHDILWQKCVALCSDRARAISQQPDWIVGTLKGQFGQIA